jgi:hypothetical protein
MPDSWGRRVTVSRLLGGGAAEDLSRLVYLLESGSDRFGALDFQQSLTEYVPRSNGQASLADLMRAAQMVEDGELLPLALRDALLGGSSIGGVRPKALPSTTSSVRVTKAMQNWPTSSGDDSRTPKRHLRSCSPASPSTFWSARSGGETRQAMATGEDGNRESRLEGCVQRASKFLLNEDGARSIADRQIDVVRTRWAEICDRGQVTEAERAFLWGRQFLNPYAFEGYRTRSG